MHYTVDQPSNTIITPVRPTRGGRLVVGIRLVLRLSVLSASTQTSKSGPNDLPNPHSHLGSEGDILNIINRLRWLGSEHCNRWDLWLVANGLSGRDAGKVSNRIHLWSQKLNE